MLSDLDYMERAFRLAERGLGHTSPNPVVGAVIVDGDGVVVGQGHHERAGEAHAEVRALEAAGPAARGGTMFCTLEPCNHHGRTAPCAEAIVQSGLARVVAAIEDPNPFVCGGGLRFLHDHGVVVTVGVGREAAARMNAPFFIRTLRQRPMVIMKIATSADGRIAAAPGQRTALTSAAAVRHVHQMRALVDAIGVGSGTILADDPLLTARQVYRERPLLRVVVDRRLRTPPTARVLTTLADGPVLIVTSQDAAKFHPAAMEALARAGATVEAASDDTLAAALHVVARHDANCLILEGGRGLHHAAWSGGLVDRVQVYIAPMSLGDHATAWLSSDELSLPSLHNLRTLALGPDVLIEGDVHRTH